MDYFTRAADPNLEPYFAQFTEDAIVEDEGKEIQGLAAIRQWRTEVPKVRYDVTSRTDTGDVTDVEASVSGDFPGSPVVLGFQFTWAPDGRIAELRIR